MPSYRYKAKDNKAQTVYGVVTARDPNEAVDKINQLGLVPVTIGPTATQGLLRSALVRQAWVWRFLRELGYLQKSGVHLLVALNIIGRSAASKNEKMIIDSIAYGVRSGRTLSDCLSDYPGVFDPFVRALVATGEASGRLAEALQELTSFLKRRAQWRSQCQKAMIYPSLLAFVGILTIFGLMAWVMPRLAEVFVETGQKLPLLTQIVFQMAGFVERYWLLGGLSGLVLVLFLIQMGRSPTGRLWSHRLALKVPLWGRLLVQQDTAIFCRALSLLLRSGVPILSALQTAADVVQSPILKKEVLVVQQRLSQGAHLSDEFQRSKHWPLLATSLIAAGAESGHLVQALNDAAEILEEETAQTLAVILALIEPMLILVIGSLIGLLVVAMLLPVFSLDVFRL